ncbi:cobalamin-binding protein [Chloroflexales bacterium ZM16-3]|nr:cobalamin-binding protein [Chloroflexales bacterium ZM16-3]
MEITTVYDRYFEALRVGDRRAALSTARDALGGGVGIHELYMDVFQPAMYAVGHLWETNQFTVAQEHLATAITQSVMAQIYDSVDSHPPIGRTMVATCIGGELHELGVRMVSDFFELEGWEVFYLGANMPPPDVVRMLESKRADLLAISMTLGGHINDVRNLISAVRESPATKKVRVMVGGQPINRSPEISQSMGADFTASNAREAIDLAMKAVA